MRRDLDEPRRQWLDADERRPEGAEFGERWHRDGGRTDDECDRVVEIVVIPITAEPRRIGRVRVRAWRHSDDQDRENGTEHAAQAQHAPMIAAMAGQVKERRLAHERRIALKIERFASRKGPKDSLTNVEIHRWIASVAGSRSRQWCERAAHLTRTATLWSEFYFVLRRRTRFLFFPGGLLGQPTPWHVKSADM